MADDWLIWQLADSAFPAGAFAHSGGLEAAWQHGRVERGPALREFLRAALTQAAHSTLPFTIAVHREPQQFAYWDRTCDAMLSNHVANRASRAQGQSLLAAATRIFPNPLFAQLQTDARQSGLPQHLATVFGFVCLEMSVEEAQTARLFLFCTLRGLISSAVRLGIIGPMEGQTIQAQLSGVIAELEPIALATPAEYAATTAPILDLLQGAQDRLYSRLFQS